MKNASENTPLGMKSPAHDARPFLPSDRGIGSLSGEPEVIEVQRDLRSLVVASRCALMALLTPEKRTKEVVGPLLLQISKGVRDKLLRERSTLKVPFDELIQAAEEFAANVISNDATRPNSSEAA